jgi:photosystem II stability/assembly factor-like uncharacterized protein
MKRVILLLLGFFCFPVPASAQWMETAPNILGPLSQTVGAMTSISGVVWAGTYTLWSSTDRGMTWIENGLNLSDDVAHIFFLDSNDGLVTTHGGSVYETLDGGATWKTILTIGSATSACFLDNTSNILVSEFQPGNVHFSRDGGATWGLVQNNNWIRQIIPNKNGKAFLLSGDWGPEEHVWISTDYGANWTEQPGEVNADSYSFDVESCNDNNMTIVNEGYSYTADYSGLSQLYESTDEGLSWTVTVSNPSKYFAGSVTEGPNTIFSQTVSQVNLGLLRSTDIGQTWINIGGPSSTGDTRLIAAIDDNHIVACDINGSIWVTSNSGGDSITLPQTTSANTELVLAEPSESVLQSTCSKIDTSIPLGIVSCSTPNAMLDSLWLTGSSAFSISDTRTSPRTLAAVDSILISYLGTLGPGDTAELHIQFDLGSGAQDTTIQLIGSVASPFLTQPAQIHREAASAFFGQIDTLSLGVDISSAINIDSLWPYITSIQASYSWDSSVVSSDSYIPPAGWSLTSLASHGNSVDIGIQNSGSTPMQPLDLGMALFRPHTTQLATTWVELPSFVIDVGSQSLSLCVTDNEDNHWAVKTLGVLSGVAEVQATTQDISIYPNPAEDELFVQNRNEFIASIEMYDEIGREVLSANATPSATSSIDIASLPSGAYFLVCHIGDRTEIKNITKQ